MLRLEEGIINNTIGTTAWTRTWQTEYIVFWIIGACMHLIHQPVFQIATRYLSSSSLSAQYFQISNLCNLRPSVFFSSVFVCTYVLAVVFPFNFKFTDFLTFNTLDIRFRELDIIFPQLVTYPLTLSLNRSP